MLNVKKIAKGVGVVTLVFFLVILGYVFMPVVYLTLTVMDNLLAMTFQVTILLVFLTVIKFLIQMLTGKTIKIPLLKTIKSKIQSSIKAH